MLAIYEHGFRNHLSCTTQLACVTYDIYESIDQRIPTDSVVLDFAKALTWCLTIYLYKQRLIDNRINHLLLRWISSFLKGRTQQVVLNGIKSQPIEVSSGVPQGSVLGLVLFTLFINNITKCIKHCAIRICADDTLLIIYHGT